MPRVNFVKKARKDYPAHGIKKGDSYYWWKFRYGGMYKSRSRPTPQQLTQSDFLIQVYDISDCIAALEWSDDIKSVVDGIISDISALADEQEEKLYNMPDSLQYSPTGELLQERADYLHEWAEELESIDLEPDYTEKPDKPVVVDFKDSSDFDIAMDDYDIEMEDLEDQDRQMEEEIIDNLQSCDYNGT